MGCILAIRRRTVATPNNAKAAHVRRSFRIAAWHVAAPPKGMRGQVQDLTCALM